MNNLDSLLSLTRAVEAAGVDIAPTYAEYVQLALAIATDCGEAGRECFHRLCRLSAKYDSRHAEKLFTNALRQGRGRMHLGTAFHLAEVAGVNCSSCGGAGMQGAAEAHTHARGSDRKRTASDGLQGADLDEELLEGSEPRVALPCFPEHEWPEPLQEIIGYGATPAQRDILLLGALTVLGACMERHVRCLYGGRLWSPCMQTFIVAPPASGKGVLSLLRQLVLPLHEELRNRTERRMKQYQQEKAAYDALGKERAKAEVPQRPKNEMFLISGNNSGTGILQNIMDADGTGLIFEVEADTISAAIGADYGHWSDTVRKTYEHEGTSYNRRTDQEYREVKKTYLSILLSGTPAQVKPLIPSAENGLFSRQNFYYMPGLRRWQDQFFEEDTDREAVFAAMGKEWKRALDRLKERGVHNLQLSEGQKAEFNRRFSGLFMRAGLTNGNEMSSSVVRLAINICRILSVVAVLRGDFAPAADIAADNVKDGIIQRWDVRINEADFLAVMGMIEPLYRHATHILSFLPGNEVNRRTNAERDAFFAALPDCFSKSQLVELAASMGINENTALSWLKRLKKQGAIRHTEEGYVKFNY